MAETHKTAKRLNSSVDVKYSPDTAYEGITVAQENVRFLIMRGDVELTVDDPAYELEKSECRKYEIKEWLTRRFAN